MADRRMFDRNIFKSSVICNLATSNPEKELESQRVFEALILMADDHGRGRLLAQVIRMEAFGTSPNTFSEITNDDILKWIKDIETEGALKTYSVEGQDYFCLTGWSKYQHGKWRPKDSKLPEPPTTNLKRKEKKRKERESPKSDDKFGNTEQSLTEVAKSDNKFRLISDTYYRLYDEKFGGKPGWGSKEQKRVKELFERYPDDSPQMIADTIEYMFKHQDKLWTENLGVFISLTGLHFDKARTLVFGGNNSNSYHCPRLCDDTAKFTKTDLGKPCPVCGSGITEFVN